MTYYFFPQMPGVEAALTLVNRPARDDPRNWHGAQFVQTAWTDGDMWQIAVAGELAEGAGLRLVRSELLVTAPPDALVVAFLSPAPIEGPRSRLPAIDHMETVPAWRANIQLCSATTAVSYQGEYPSKMAALQNATLLSIAPLVQRDAEVETCLAIVNISIDPAFREHDLLFHRAADWQLIHRTRVSTNRCNVIRWPDTDAADTLCAVTCTGMTGIPLYFAHNRDFSQMNLEHSHPPIEAVVFGDRLAVNRDMKTAWFSRC